MSIHVCINSPLLWSDENNLSFASFLLSLSKTPSVKHVHIFGEAPAQFLDKVPRSITLYTKPKCLLKDFYLSVLEVCKSSVTDLVFIIPELSQLVVPETVHSAALAQRVCDYSFLTENTEGLSSVKFVELRHWTVGAAHSGPAFMTKCFTFIEDHEEFENEFCFDVLKVLKKRLVACPLPSLACPLPLKVQPPIIPWKQVHDVIKSAMF
jgi:hypothetical protein